MAEKFNIKQYYDNIARLFQDGPKIRHRIASKIMAPGESGTPIGTARAFLKNTSNLFSSQIAAYGTFNRNSRYSDYQEMESHSIIASALDIVADECTVKGEYGEVLRIHSPNRDIRKTLETLFYDVLNIEFNSWTWIRNLCKYGDHLLLLDHHPDYGILNALPMPVNEVEREEAYDPANPFAYRFRWVTQGNREIPAWQVVHFRMIAGDQFLPYGMSYLEPARRTWRQLIMMEDAIMIYRIVRSPERRVFYVDVGNIPPKDVPQYMEQVKTQTKRSMVVDANTGRVDLRYHAITAEDDYYLPKRGAGENSSRIEPLPGGQFTGDIEDLEYFKSKLLAALKIPKSYIGYDEGIGSKSQLSMEDVRFARTIQRIQRIFISELNKIAVLHLYSKGYSSEDLINFEISMTNPSTISEMQQLELWRGRFEAAQAAQEGLLDKHFIYKRLFRLSDEDIVEIEEGRKRDKELEMEIESIQPPATEEVPPEGGESTPDTGTGEAPPAEPTEPEEPEGMGAGDTTSTTPLDANAGESPVTDARDPNIQRAMPNELKGGTGRKEKLSAMSNLKKHAFGTKKTGLDFKRAYNQMMGIAKNPFGEAEENDFDDVVEEHFQKNQVQLNRFASDLEKVEGLKGNSKNKKIL